ncbi:cyclase family protein [Marinactinospora thermotolerans]|uniref:Kynurenine formamidase n=1 Tax=Marinactinospora thermotolerans DSM 45154 TaxID=1122192 RepID=A0A1T4SLX3_9ACTN|nr:cyclase family protein [Marinactinospora thermotolerans]SKA28898.1 Kynurenine formamidase [Marinactinospora thermotolerans DSM 45154]
MRVTHVVDLSHPVGPQTQVYPGDPVPSLTPVATLADDGYNLAHVSMGTQSGTHADAPFHFFDAGARIDELALDLFVGPAVVIDVSGRRDRSSIDWADISAQATGVGPGKVVLLRTGWARHYGKPRYFDHPYLSGEAAARLVAAGVRTIGIDAPNPDETPREGTAGGDWPVHRTVLGAGGVLIENLRGLEEIDFPDPLFSAVPVRLAGADGAPVRAMAMRVRP